jgi:hypothetical protein
MAQAIEIRLLKRILRSRQPAVELRKVLRAAEMVRRRSSSGPLPQLALWLDGRPWRAVYVRWLCIGCKKAEVRVKFTYCPRCKKRLDAGLPVDLDDYVTDADYRALAKRMPGDFGGRKVD